MRTRIACSLLLLLFAVASCAATKDEILSKTIAGVNAAQASFVTYDKSHQDAIVDGATSLDAGKAALASYRDQRSKVQLAFVAAYGALAAASLDPSTTTGLVQAADAARALLAALRSLGVIQ